MDEILLRVYPHLRFAYHGHSLLVTDRAGAIEEGLEGLYEDDGRLLSRLRLVVHGTAPRLDSASAVGAHSTLAYYVAPPRPGAADERDALGLSKDERDRQVVIRVARFVGRGLHEDVEVTNYGLDEARLAIGWELAADFADVMEARGGERQQEAPISVDWEPAPGGEAWLRFTYQHPDLRPTRGTLVRVGPRADVSQEPLPQPAWDGGCLAYSLTLRPGESRQLCFRVAPMLDRQTRGPLFGCDTFEAPPEAARDALVRASARLEVSNRRVQAVLNRGAADLAALELGDGETPEERLAPAAGIPLYGTLFGRDALTASGQALLVSPAWAEGTLRLLARFLGTKEDDFYDEQPGRVPQQVRQGPLSLLDLQPWRHDYGDYAAPCAFLVLLGTHHIVAGDDAFTREMLDPATRVLAWLDQRADLDGDGFLEYKSRSPKGQKHQGWKDAGNAVVREDGSQVEPPVAPCEIQGYWYAAQLLMAEVFFALGERSRALELAREAMALKRHFNERFWVQDEGTYAFGLDADKRQIRSVVSNVGHCLARGIVDKERASFALQRRSATPAGQETEGEVGSAELPVTPGGPPAGVGRP